MLFYGAHIATVRGGDEDCAARVSSLSNEEPLVVMEVCVNVVGKVVREDCRNGGNCMIRERKTPLCCGRYWGIFQRSSRRQNRDVCRYRGISSHQGSIILSAWRGNVDVVRVDGDIVVEWGEEEGVEQFLGNARRSGRHLCMREVFTSIMILS